MALPFFATAFLFDGELFPFVGLGSALIIPGVMVGFAASRKTRLYSARALMMNVFGTVLGGFSGMVTYYSTINSDIDRQSIVHAVPAIFLTLGGTTLTYLISRYAIVDEPDNAGTWLGVLGGTALGALTGFGIGTIWKYGGRDSYLAGITTAFVIGGAIMGELIGFAASHTTMPDRKIMSKEKKVSVSILPPMMVPERIPMSNKTFKRWMILNAGLSF
jgi:hypothetical protein